MRTRCLVLLFAISNALDLQHVIGEDTDPEDNNGGSSSSGGGDNTGGNGNIQPEPIEILNRPTAKNEA